MKENLLGVTVHPSTAEELRAIIAEAAGGQGCRIFAYHNLHSLYLYHHDARMRFFFAHARHVHIDGMALIFLGRLLGLPLRRQHRLTSVDWLPFVLEDAQRRGWRTFYLGSGPGVAERGAEVLRGRFPALEMKSAHGYFDARPSSQESAEVLETINGYRPDLLLVGMGMPRQEHWILDNIGKIHAAAILTCGAWMDYIAGEAPTPPRWMGRIGLEWLFRLLSQPGRLWKRYLIEPWYVLGLLVCERLGWRRGI